MALAKGADFVKESSFSLWNFQKFVAIEMQKEPWNGGLHYERQTILHCFATRASQ